jgi:hypothetical protein
MLTLQQISDRREIDDVLIAYCHAIDSHAWDELDAVFTPDAWVDYTVFGGPAGPYPEIKSFLAEALPRFAYAQHIISTSRVKLDGDRATARTICTNPVGIREESGEVRHVVYALWYVDELVRTEQGWRLSRRSEEVSHALDLAATPYNPGTYKP